MNWLKQNELKAISRTQSFINRSLFSVLVINKKKLWKDVISTINKNIYGKGNYCGKGKYQNKNGSNVRCLKIQECQFEIRQQMDNQKQKNKISGQVNLEIPLQMVTKLFINLNKLVIIKCNIDRIQFNSQISVLFPNLIQFDGSQNKLKQFPKFIYRCNKLNKIDLSENFIHVIPHHLEIMIQLKYIRIFGNPVQKISSILFREAVCGTKVIQIQWKLNLISDIMICQNEVIQSVPSVRTNFTEGDEQSIHNPKYEKYSLYNTKKKSITSESILSIQINNENYIDIKQILKQKLKIFMKQNYTLVSKQLEVLINCQHVQYLQYVQELMDEDLCRKYIDYSFKYKKYKALDFLLTKYQQFQQKHQLLDELFKQKQAFKIDNKNKSARQQFKTRKKEENSLLVGLKKIKILTIKKVQQRQRLPQYYLSNIKNIKLKQNSSNECISLTAKPSRKQKLMEQMKKINIGSDCNSSYSSHDLSMYNLNKSDKSIWQNNCEQNFANSRKKQPKTESPQFVMQKLSTYNSLHIRSIPQPLLKQVSLTKLIWWLNELQFIQKIRQQKYLIISSVFKLMQIKIIVNNIINTQNQIIQILNQVTYKQSIKLLFINTQIQFFKYFSFNSTKILYQILVIQDYQLIKYLIKKYIKLYLFIFQNLSSCQNYNNNNSQFQYGRSWKWFVLPHSKIYKYLYKQYKMFIYNLINTNHTHNQHLPSDTKQNQLNPSKAIPVTLPKLLKQYQQFHQSCKQYKPKPRSKPKPLITPVSSLKKRIQISLSENSQKNIKSIDVFMKKNEENEINQKTNKQNIIKSQNEIKKNYSLNNFCLQNKSKYHQSLLYKGKTQRQYNKQINNKLFNHNQYKNKKKSINIICRDRSNHLKYQQKKKGISLCSHSILENKSIQEFYHQHKKINHFNRTAYLEMSQPNKRVTNNKDIIIKNHQKNKLNIKVQNSQEIICSTFQSN